MKLKATAALSLLSATLFAQSVKPVTPIKPVSSIKPVKTVKYNITKAIDSTELDNGGTVYIYSDKSMKTTFLGHAVAANAEMAQNDLLRWTAGLGAELYLSRFGSIRASYLVPVFDLTKLLAGNNTNTNANEIQGFNFIDAGVSYNFVDKHTKKKHIIILESHRSGNSTINYYINPLLPCRQIMSVRAGVFSYRAVIDNDLVKGGIVTAADGAKVTTFHTNASTTGGYIGFSSTKIFNTTTRNTLKDRTTRRGKGDVFKTKSVKNAYVDVMYGNTTIAPVADINGNHPIVTDASGSFQSMKIGVRGGVQLTEGVLTRKIELGYRPGLTGTGLYGAITIAFTLMK